MTHEERCEKALTGLQEWVHKLSELANEIVESAQCLDNDDLGIMSLCFLRRQIHHVQSVDTLFPNRDIILIARSMIEGLYLLLWAAQIPTERPLKWRAFAYVHSWRLQQDEIKRGESINPEQQKSTEMGLQEYGKLFYVKKAKLAVEKGTALPTDPYHKTWTCGTPLSTICSSVEAYDTYKTIYSSFSDWHHWGTAGIGETLSLIDDKVIFYSSSSSKSATALAMVFQCLLQTMELTNEHLSLAKELQISKIRDEYIKWNQKRCYL